MVAVEGRRQHPSTNIICSADDGLGSFQASHALCSPVYARFLSVLFDVPNDLDGAEDPLCEALHSRGRYQCLAHLKALGVDGGDDLFADADDGGEIVVVLGFVRWHGCRGDESLVFGREGLISLEKHASLASCPLP